MSVDLGDDRAALDRLLGQLAARLDGAVDMWSLVCLGPIPVDRRAFIEKHASEMQSLVSEAAALIRRAPSPGTATLSDLVGQLIRACGKLRDAFLVLEHHQAVPLEAVHQATTALTEVYDDFRQTLGEIGQATNVSVGYLENRPAERQAYVRRILDGLYEQFRHQRDAEQQSAIPSGTA